MSRNAARGAHSVGATVREVTLESKTSGVDYSVDAPAGEITELGEFGNGNTVLTSYTTDFVLPATYPLALNASPGLGEESGEWTGKPLVDGTYTLGIWSSRSLPPLVLFGETNSYKSTSDSKNQDFLVGSATLVEPYDLIASGSSCFNCHQELAFHGFGRRGFESCVLCHGTAGAEDRPTYVAGNAPATTGLTVSFRTMLHKIHMGEELANASSYDVVGHGSARTRTTSGSRTSARSSSRPSRAVCSSATSATATTPGRSLVRARTRPTRALRSGAGRRCAARATTRPTPRRTSRCRPTQPATSPAACATARTRTRTSSSSTSPTDPLPAPAERFPSQVRPVASEPLRHGVAR